MTAPTKFTCLLCAAKNLAPPETLSRVLRDDDSGKYTVVRCPTCEHVQITPLPTPEDDAAFYGEDRQTKSLFGNNGAEIVRQKAEPDTRRRLAWLMSRKTPSQSVRVLDVGCGYGLFVDAATKAGFQATGLDTSTERLKFARASMAGAFLKQELDDVFIAQNAGQFDVITAFHVAEHLADPISFIRRVLALLTPNGIFLAEVPSFDDEIIAENPEYRAFQFQRAHLSYFSAASLSRLLKDSGAKTFQVAGVQRYGLRHLLHWSDHRKPQLEVATNGTSRLLDRLEISYRADREDRLSCDTLIAEATAQ